MKNTSYFKNRNKTRKPAGKIIIFIIIPLLVIIPTVLAVVGYYIKSDNIIGANSLKVSLFYDGVLIGEESDDPENENADDLVLIFDSMINKLKKSESLPNSISTNPAFDVNISTRTNTYNYKCYFSIDPNKQSYCIDSENNIYIIDTDTANAFLSSKYSETLYFNSRSPKMYSSSDEEILPYSHLWYYKDSSNSFQQAAPLKQYDSPLEYNMSGQLGLSFDIVPDTCTVRIYKSGIKIYDGNLDELSAFLVDAGTNLQFDVSAEWLEKNNNDFYGTVRYNFKVLVRDRANFILDKTAVNTGDFVLVSCTNVLDASKVEFASEPSIKCTPVFFSDNGVVRTILPISNGLDEGEYKLTFSYGATTETLPLTVSKAEKPKDYTLKTENAALLSNLTNNNNHNKLADTIKSLELNNNIFIRSKFIDYRTTGAEDIAKFGALVTTSTGSVSHKIDGTQFVWKDNKNAVVSVLNSGIVVKVDNNAYLGDFVIVEHGLGLRTVYSHLDAIFVNEGDILSKGQQIGLCGSLDVVSPSGVFIMCFVYDIPINYDSLADKELTFYYPEIKEEE